MRVPSLVCATLVLWLSLGYQPALAQQQPPAAADAKRAPAVKPPGDKPERGWFFFDDPKAAEPEPEPPPAAPRSLPREAPPPPKEEACKKRSTWSPTCGFVDPGSDFEFQAKQRDALMERMVVSKNDPKAVEDFQYYMRWALERVAEVTNVWSYNMAQNPALDPGAAQPISAMGLRLMTDVRQGSEAEIIRLLGEEGAFLLYFSRHDCHFCHSMAPVIQQLAQQLRIPLHNAALDDKCIEGLVGQCAVAPRTTIPAQALQVSVVPAVFLYVPKSTFIRIATGVSDVATMRARALQYFQATRTALLRGVENGTQGRPSVDFSSAPTGTAKGVGSSEPARLPSEQEMRQLLGGSGQ